MQVKTFFILQKFPWDFSFLRLEVLRLCTLEKKERRHKDTLDCSPVLLVCLSQRVVYGPHDTSVDSLVELAVCTVCVRVASQTSGWARRMLRLQRSAASPAFPLLLTPLSATQQAYWWGQWRSYGMQLSSPCGCCADMGDIQSQIMQVIHSCHTERELPSCSNVYGHHEFQVRAEEDKKMNSGCWKSVLF